MIVEAKDCSKLKMPSSKELPKEELVNWLSDVASNVKAKNLTISVSGSKSQDNDERIVHCDREGTWWTGRYIGTLSYKGHCLNIQPRFGLDTIRDWLIEATSVVTTNVQGELQSNSSFIIQLLAYVWVQGIIEAARHGLPSLRRDVTVKSATIRGRLDVSKSIRLIAARQGQVISVHSEKSLDHAASSAIIAAYRVLRKGLGIPDEKWMPSRAIELVHQLLAVTGPHPTVPTQQELEKVRYTPITIGFAKIAELSRQIANRQGLTTEINKGDVKGLLLDVAELWELYVLSVLRKGSAAFSVSHGTRERSASKFLLSSDINKRLLGKLMPDGILYEQGNIKGVVDAKYKSIFPSQTAPDGPQREDLYQMAAYLGRFKSQEDGFTWGLLAYPQDPLKTYLSEVEKNSPWSLDQKKKIFFAALPHKAIEATDKIRGIVEQMNNLSFSK